MTLAAMACIGLNLVSSSAHADESLGDLRLSLRQTDPGGVTPSNRPRLAVLLIDRSSSMTYGVNGDENMRRGPANPERWGEMKKGVRSTLEQLLTSSKGIELRIRFFSNTLDTNTIRETLDGPESVDRVMAALDQQRPDGTTVLYQATSAVCDQIIESTRKNHYEWILFGIYSDGKDGTSPAPHTARTRDAKVAELQLETKKHDGHLEYLVFTVGPDAKGDYGQAQIKDLNSRIPKPPHRPATYVLELAPGQPRLIVPRQPAAKGVYSIAVSLTADDKVLPAGGMRVIPGISDGSAMRLVSRDLVLKAGATAPLGIEVPSGTDVSKGLSAELTFEPGRDDKDSIISTGTAQVRLAFAADELLPRDKWHDSFPRAIKRGEAATFFLDPGKAANFTWTFTGPGGAVLPVKTDEKQFERSFDQVGTWGVQYSCTSQADKSRVVTKMLHDFEVVDAAFHLAPEKVTVDPGTDATITIVPNPGATSKAVYRAELDDEAIAVDGRNVVVSKDKLRDDTHYLSVTATVEAGGMKFLFPPQKRVIKVKRARIVRLSRASSPEPPSSLPPGAEAVFQVVDIDTAKVDSVSWSCTLPDGQTQSPPTPDFLRVTPAACGTLIVNARVSLKDGSEVKLEEHFNVGGVPPSATPKLVPDVTAIRLLGTSVKLEPGIDGTCREARAWLVPEDAPSSAPLWEQKFDPRLKQVQIAPKDIAPGRYCVHLEVTGYPNCEPWTERAPLTLTLTPRRKYDLWLISMATMAAIGWLIHRWLWGNDPLRWWIDFSFNNPGPPTPDGGGNYTLYIGEPTPASPGHRSNYLGWNRWRKQAFVPLWLFAERADSSDASWLKDPRWAEATLKIVNVWKNPFKLAGDLAVNWKSEVRYNDLDSAEPISRTLWLQPPWDGGGKPPAIWMRMHCPRGGDPHLWFLWTWIGAMFVAAALLAHVFNII